MKGPALACLVAIVVAVCWVRGSYVAGGSDSYCYVHQAERWASGRLQVVEPLALRAPWPNGPLAFAPAGHIPSSTVPGAIVPICPSGLSIAMAPFVLIAGPSGAFVALPLFGALLLVGVAAVGSRFGARVGLASAALTAASPIVLYQVIQPMSDVPAAALWAAAVASATSHRSRGPLLAGLAASAAILVRPNLVPLGFVIGAYLLLRPERTAAERLRAGFVYAAACALGCVAVLAINRAFYGGPFESGYGGLSGLFSTANVSANAGRYLRWLLESHTPAVVLALAAPMLLPGAISLLLAGLVAVNVLLYLPYQVFEDWSYLRFLLPSIPFLLVLVAAAFDAAWRRARLPGAGTALAVAVAVLAWLFVSDAGRRPTWRLQTLESRFARAGRYAGEALPPRALVITRWQSGSVRFYAGRKTLLWDGLPPDALDAAVAFARREGYEPYLLLERWEEPEFRRHFGARGLGALDWPPVAEIASQVRIYRPDDRALYFRGERIDTRYVP